MGADLALGFFLIAAALLRLAKPSNVCKSYICYEVLLLEPMSNKYAQWQTILLL